MFKSVRMYARPSQNVQLCTADKRLDFETPIFVHRPNVNDFDFHFQGQRFESSTLSSSYVIISQTATSIAIANTESHI